jgi:hypothetical protein
VSENINENIEKPSDWPANGREVHISKILKAVEIFEKEPNYKNKEILISLVSPVDLNENNGLGLFRVTEYEVSIINELYLKATALCFYDLKVFLYEQIADTARSKKMAYLMIGGDLNIKEYEFLYPPLYLFYLTYANFNLEKERTFPEQLIHEIKLLIKGASSEKLQNYSWMLNNLLIDLSWFPSAKMLHILTWNRQELKNVFTLQISLITLTKQNPLTRPLKGVLMITISNWILKSRNNYNDEPLIKYVSDSINLDEIWMKEIKYLNDKREQTVIKELYKNEDWIKFDWAKKIDLTPRRKTYVSSFSKGSINAEMQDGYGNNVYGYKSDRIRAAIAPIILMKNKYPQFGHVICYDIVYNINDAKDELNSLSEIIDLYDITDENKNTFLNEIIQYWILSFKDKEWQHEKERRYQIMLYPELDYIELTTDEIHLKLKSSLFAFPDFISKNNNNKKRLEQNLMYKRKAISSKPYVFCKDCLHADYDNSGKKCLICGSTRVA